ncbi:hypothetical protein BRD04_10390 [Halobacteriales archaeon QS_9_67_17]|nr:MAG: hypothetical protein BRD04_10390 [Halobacteriales archaeon QS_9_67_17]
MVADGVVATLVAVSVSVSLPCFLYGAWIMIDNDPVTWGVLTWHLKYILTGLVLTTVPLVGWMIPRLFGLQGHSAQFGGYAVLHAFVGSTAYAFLAFGFTGIVRVFRAKYEHDLYHDYDQGLLLDEIGGDRMDHWRSRLRVGVFGYTFFWILAWLTGLTRYAIRYL